MGKARKALRKAKIADVEEALEEERLAGKVKKTKLKGKGQALAAKEAQEKDAEGGGEVGEAASSSAGAEKKEGDLSELFTVDTAGSFVGISRTQRKALARAKLFPPKAPKLGLSGAEEMKVERAERGMADQVIRDAKAAAEPDPDLIDLWSTPLPTALAKKQLEGRLSGESMVKLVAGDKPASAPKSLHQKVSNAPAVLLAHEGQSVNPTPAAFETLACTAAAKELERERELESLDRQMAPMTAALKDEFGADAVKEMSEEAKVAAYRKLIMPDTVEQEEQGGADGSDAKDTVRRSVKEKSSSKRNKETTRKVKAHLENQEKKQKKLEKEVGQVGEILKEMKEREKFLAERSKFRKEAKLKRRADEKAFGCIPKHRRLGKTKFMEEALIIPDAEAASRGLRCMPIGGRTAVKDRVESIMRRGLLPAPPEAQTGDVRRLKQAGRQLQKTRKAVDPILRTGLNS